MKIGDFVRTEKMASDSFYEKVQGVITDIRNGRAWIDATWVILKEEAEWRKHPGTCSTSAKLEDCRVVTFPFYRARLLTRINNNCGLINGLDKLDTPALELLYAGMFHQSASIEVPVTENE